MMVSATVLLQFQGAGMFTLDDLGQECGGAAWHSADLAFLCLSPCLLVWQLAGCSGALRGAAPLWWRHAIAAPPSTVMAQLFEP